MEYHAPTDCGTIKRWLIKCADDSETANYISAHTKDVYHLFYSICNHDLLIHWKIFSVRNVIFALKRMVAAITCNVTVVNTIFAGCVLEIGKHTGANITNVRVTKRIQISLTKAFTRKHERL